MDLNSDRAGVQFSNHLTTVDEFHGKCKLLTQEVKHILEEERFNSGDFWIGYKFYCYGRYSQCHRSRQQFMDSKMGRVVTAMHKRKNVPWGSFFDEALRQLWAEMEEYGEVFHGQDWCNLRALMEEFDDVKKLSASANGSLLMKLVEDDDHGTEREHKRRLKIEFQHTDIFDEVRGRLNTIDSNLESLRESGGQSSKCSVHKKRKHNTTFCTYKTEVDRN